MSKKSNFKFYWKCQRACYLLKITIILDFSIFKFSSCWDFNSFSYLRGFPDRPSDKKSACQYWRHTRLEFNPWVRKIWWRRKWQPTSLFLPGKFHGQRSLMGYGRWDLRKSDKTGQLSTPTHTYLKCTNWWFDIFWDDYHINTSTTLYGDCFKKF